MKIQLSLLQVIAIFTIGCFGFLDEPDGLDASDEAHLLEKTSAFKDGFPKQTIGDPEEEMSFDDRDLASERGTCCPTISCRLAGGHCIKRKQACSGTIDPRGCTKRKCKCCIPETTPVTCPVVTSTSCPTEDLKWSDVIHACIRRNNYRILKNTTIEDCKEKCVKEIEILCKSIDYNPKNGECHLSGSGSDSSSYTEPCYVDADGWLYAEREYNIVPAGFERRNGGRVIRRTVTSDLKSNYYGAMKFCKQFKAVPFIPRTQEEHDLYKVVRTSLGLSGNQWLPANDRQQEGTLRWYDGTIAHNISFWDWPQSGVMAHNSEVKDCLFYGKSKYLVVYLMQCDNGYKAYPPICEII